MKLSFLEIFLLLTFCLLIPSFVAAASGGNGDPEADKKKDDREKMKEVLAKNNQKMRLELDKLAKEQANDEGFQKQLKEIEEARKKNPNEEKEDRMPKRMGELNAEHLDELYQGDIMLTNEQAIQMLGEGVETSSSTAVSNSTRRRRGAALNPAYYTASKWTNAVVPYMFDASVSTTLQALTQKAMNLWSDNSCITFQLNPSAPNKLRFKANEAGCWSYIGRISSWASQDVNIGPGCEYIGIISHEIGHALGFFHEQSRHDRDNFVIYNAANVDPNAASNFNKETTTTNENYGHRYDLGSVMHYADTDFSINGQPVLLARLGAAWQRTMGQRMRPSHYDFKVMNSHYCQAKCTTALTCYNGGILNPKNCAACICPPETSGTQCQNAPTYGPSYNAAWTSTGYAPPNVPNTCTGKMIWALDTAQYLTGQIGTTNTGVQNVNDYAWCHWVIVGTAVDKRIAVEVLEVGDYCTRGCFFGHTEISIRENGEWGGTGVRLCCTSDLGSTGTLTLSSAGGGYSSAGVPVNEVRISMYASYYVQRFKIRFWQY